MPQRSLSLEEAIDMDYILKSLLSFRSDPKDCMADTSYIYHKFLKEKGEYYTVDLVYKFLDHDPKVITATQKSGIRTTIWPTPLIHDFLSKGGFTKIANDILSLNKFEKEKDQLNFEKLRYDVRNSKRIFKTYWWTFSMSIIALILSLITVFKGCK